MSGVIVPAAERPGKEADLPYVMACWLNGHRKSCRDMREMRTDDYFALQHQRIQRLLATTAHLVVLHPEGTPDVIAAWAVLDSGGESVAHYVYVRSEYRGMGFARRLLAGRTICTHMTDGGKSLKAALGLRYMPHLLDGLA